MDAIYLERINSWLMSLKSICLPPELYNLSVKEIDQLIQYMYEHKAVVRFYNKLKSAVEIDQLKTLYNRIETEINSIKAFIHPQRFKMMNLLQGYTGDYMLLKGVTSEVLTGNADLLRVSDDWDIWARDPKDFTEYASHNGFLVDNESCAPHEFSKLLCADNDEIMIEVHQSFPNISIPTELLCRDLTTKVGYLNISYPSFSDISGEITSVKWGSYGNIRIASIELAVIIMCMNVYRDSLYEPYKLPNVRLLDLLEIYMLSKSEKFSAKKFGCLVDKFNSRQSVSFCHKLLSCFYEDVALPDYNIDLRILKLMNAEFSVFLLQDSSNFFHRLCCETFESRVQTLHPTRIKLDEWYSTKDFFKYQGTDGSKDKEFDFDFTFIKNESENLSLRYQVDGTKEHNDNFFVIFKNHMEHLHMHINAEDEFYYDSFGLRSDESFMIEESSKVYDVIFNFRHVDMESEIYAVVAVEKFMNGVRHQTIVPIVVEQ